MRPFVLLRSQMIGQEEFAFISRFDVPDPKTREAVIREQPMQLAKTFFSMLNSISKDQTIQGRKEKKIYMRRRGIDCRSETKERFLARTINSVRRRDVIF